MSNQSYLARLRVPVRILIIGACAMAPAVALAQEVTLKDAIKCKDFKHNADGSWHAEDVSLSYGSGSNQKQVNMFGPTTIAKAKPIGDVDLWSLLNEKCGAGH